MMFFFLPESFHKLLICTDKVTGRGSGLGEGVGGGSDEQMNTWIFLPHLH